MKRPIGGSKRPSLAAATMPTSCCLILAFGLLAVRAEQSVGAGQQVGGQAALMGAPTLSMGSDSSLALESSAAMAGDDLMAAESAQPLDATPEHKAFTSQANLMRSAPEQAGQAQPQAAQVPASVAPAFAQPQVFGQAQSGLNARIQQQSQLHQQRLAHQLQQQVAAKTFNPFMAAALAGNYGPAQQQIAAAAAASLQARHHPQIHPNNAAIQQHQQQMAAQMHQQQHQHLQQHQQHQQHQQQLQNQQPQVVSLQPGPMAVQESSVRQNVVPAPQLDALNSIEIGSEQNSGRPESQQQLAVASSAQHPVIAAASSSSSSSSSSSALAIGQEPNQWPLQAPDIPKIVNLEVKCEKNLMKVSIEFDKVFNGVIFSKGHYNQGQCLHVGQNSGKQQAYFDISINSCGTQGNTQNGLYGMGGNTGSGTFFENTIVIQYDPSVQEVYDHARKLRCTWHDQYEKAVTFRPFPVDMLDIVRADFAGDNVGCWMQIQVGKGPWASEVAGIVKIGQTMTMVLAIKDEENKFDMLVRNCFAHDGKRGPIELVDKSGCITRPKLMSRFTKIKNFGSSATVLSYAHFQAFKFPDSMEVHFQCTIQICRHQCPEQCSTGPAAIGNEAYSESTISGAFNIQSGAQSQQQQQQQQQHQGSADSVHLRKYGSASLSRERRDLSGHTWSNASHHQRQLAKPASQTVGLNRVIQVVSSGDLAFAIQQQQQQVVNGTNSELAQQAQLSRSQLDMSSQICMSSFNFVLSLVVLALVLLCSSLLAVTLYVRQRSLATQRSGKSLLSGSSCPSPSSSLRPVNQSHHVPSQANFYQQHQFARAQ